MSGFPPRSDRWLAFARRYVRRRISRGLDGLRVRGLAGARAAAGGRPLLIAANHVGWWDSLLVVALDEALGTEGYALMDRDGLARVPYFARLGGLAMDRSSPARLRADLRAAAARLDRPRRALWVFPQGHYRPAHARPLGFQGGIALLARLAPDAAVLPVAVSYVQGPHPVPAAVVRLGPVLGGTVDVGAVERAVEAGLAEIDAEAPDGGWPGWETLVAPRHRAPEEGIGARLLGRRLERERPRG